MEQHLSQTEAEHFFHLLTKIERFANEKRKIVKDFAEWNDIESKHHYELQQYFFSNVLIPALFQVAMSILEVE